MRFPFNVYAAALISAALTSACSLPLWRRFCLKTGLLDDPGHRKIHAQPIPLAGGLAVMTGLLAPALVATLFVWLASGGSSFHETVSGSELAGTFLTPGAMSRLRHGLDVRAIRILAIFLGALGMLIVGLLDDKHELRPRPKFIGQVLIAVMVAASGIRVTLFVPNIWFSYGVTVLWILTVINAVNFMDNMNGLCAGLGVIACWFFAMVAAAFGQYLVALMAFLSCGAIAGFLPFNFPRARAFLGDGGSHLIGYLLAVLAILPHFYTPTHRRRLAVLIPLIVLAVPLLDMAYVVVLRCRLHKPVYQGDMNHLSHRLLRLGLSQTASVLLIWFLAGALGALIYFC